MAKSFNLEITSFENGMVAEHLLAKNKNFHALNSCSFLNNMVVDINNNLVRRPPSNLLQKDFNEPRHFFAFEYEQNSIVLSFYHEKLVISFGKVGLWQTAELKSPLGDFVLMYGLDILVNYQSSEVYVFSPNFPPQVLTFNENLAFTFKALLFKSEPFGLKEKEGITLNITNNSGTYVCNASSDVFDLTDIGRFLKYKSDDLWVIAKIKSVAHKRQVVLEKAEHDIILGTFKRFKLSAFGFKDGFPKYGIIFENRLYLIASKNNTTSVFISKHSDLLNFGETTRIKETLADKEVVEIDAILYDNAISFEITTALQNMWLQSNNYGVLVGCKKGIYTILPQNPEEGFSPFNFAVKKVGQFESSAISQSNGNEIFFVDSNLKDIYVVAIAENQILHVHKVNLYVPQLFKNEIKDIILTSHTFGILWILFMDGSMVSFSILTSQDGRIYACSCHSLKAFFMANAHRYLYISGSVGESGVMQYLDLQDLQDCYTKDIIYLDNKQSAYVQNQQIIVDGSYNNTFLSVVTFADKIQQYFMNLEVKDGTAKVALEDGGVICGFSYPSMYQSGLLNSPNTLGTLSKVKKIVNTLAVCCNSSTYSISNEENKKYYDGNADLKTISTVFNSSTFPKLSILQNTVFPLNISALQVTLDISE